MQKITDFANLTMKKPIEKVIMKKNGIGVICLYPRIYMNFIKTMLITHT